MLKTKKTSKLRITGPCEGNPPGLATPGINTKITISWAHIQFATPVYTSFSWRRHQMETFPALLAICAGNSPVTGEFAAQRPVTQSFDVFFDLRLAKRLSKNGEASDLRCHCAHYDVTVMHISNSNAILQDITIGVTIYRGQTTCHVNNGCLSYLIDQTHPISLT